MRRFLKGRFVGDGEFAAVSQSTVQGLPPAGLGDPSNQQAHNLANAAAIAGHSGGWWNGLMERASQSIDFAAFGQFASALPGMLTDLRDRLDRIERRVLDIDERLRAWEGKTERREPPGDI